MLTDFQPVNAVRDLAILAPWLNSWTEIGVPQRDAMRVAARGVDNLPGRDGPVGFDPVAPPPAVGRGRVGDLLAVAVQRGWREPCHREPRTGVGSLDGDCIKARCPARLPKVRRTSDWVVLTTSEGNPPIMDGSGRPKPAGLRPLHPAPPSWFRRTKVAGRSLAKAVLRPTMTP